MWDRDEFLRQCSGVPHGVSANTWARAMWLISNGEATEPTAMVRKRRAPLLRLQVFENENDIKVLIDEPTNK